MIPDHAYRRLSRAARDADPEPVPARPGAVAIGSASTSGSNIRPATTLTEGASIGPYRILGLLGRGGMGIVYRAHDPRLGRDVAVKVLRSADDPGMAARLEREARATAQLSHPHIVTLYEAGVADGLPYLSMELVPGESLVEKLPALGISAKVAILEKVARAVHHAHLQGIVHRDLKPGNIMLRPDGEPVVMDFGLARTLETAQSLTETGGTVGTPRYMAPEQCEGRREALGPRTDVYALGVILYEMLSRRAPFEGENFVQIAARIAHQEAVDPRRLDPRIPADLSAICLKAIEKDPARRYASAEDLAEDLRRWRTGNPIMARPPSVLYQWRKRVFRHKAMTAVVGMAVIVLLIVQIRSAARVSHVERSRQPYEAALGKTNAFLVAVATHPGRAESLGAEAVAALEAALEVDNRQPSAWVWLGRCRKILGDDPSTCWERALSVDGTHAEALLERGRERLERYLRQRREGAASYTGSREVYGAARPETREEFALRESAEKDLEGARRVGVAVRLADYLEGLAAFGKGDYARAESLVSGYLSETGWDREAFLLRSRVRRIQSRYAGAIEDVTRAIEMNGRDARAWCDRGVILYEAEKAVEAEKDLSRTVEMDPACARAWFYRGLVHFDARAYPKAEADFTRAIEQDPSFAPAYNSRGNLYTETKRHDAAEADYAKAIAEDSQFAKAHFNRGLLYRDLKRHAEALRDWERAVALDSSMEGAIRPKIIEARRHLESSK